VEFVTAAKKSGQLLSPCKSKTYTLALERHIEEMVYKLYNLTLVEISIVEGTE